MKIYLGCVVKEMLAMFMVELTPQLSYAREIPDMQIVL